MSASEQARKDAMADAETLRSIVLPYGCGAGFEYAHALSYAYCAEIVAPLGLGREDGNRAYYHARWAARHAFTAVPGLRDDR